MLTSFLSMVGTYEQRKVANFTKGDLQVDTVVVTDSDKPFETAVAHPKFNGGKWIIVELYDTKEQAQKGHDEWVKKMTDKKLPKELKDVSTAEIAKICDIVDKDWRVNN
jgi:predicted transcriptional regulator of viral defense system